MRGTGGWRDTGIGGTPGIDGAPGLMGHRGHIPKTGSATCANPVQTLLCEQRAIEQPRGGAYSSSRAAMTSSVMSMVE